MRAGRQFRAAVVAAALAAASFCACSSPAKLVGEGGECTLATDCEAGLVCIPQQNGKSKCSSDLSSIVHVQDGGAAQGGGTADAPPPASDAAGDGPSPQETGAQDSAGPQDASGGDAPAD